MIGVSWIVHFAKHLKYWNISQINGHHFINKPSYLLFVLISFYNMTNSISQQNIRRELSLSGRMLPGTHRAGIPDQTVVLSNNRIPSCEISVDLPRPLTQRTITLQQLSVHSLSAGAPADAGRLEISLAPFGQTEHRVTTYLPFGPYLPSEFADLLEFALNQTCTFTPDTSLYERPTAKHFTYSAPDLATGVYDAHTTFLEVDGIGLPLEKFRECLASNRGSSARVVVVQAVETNHTFQKYACTVLPLPDNANMPVTSRNSVALSTCSMTLTENEMLPFETRIPDDVLLSLDPGGIPDHWRAANEYIALADFEMDWLSVSVYSKMLSMSHNGREPVQVIRYFHSDTGLEFVRLRAGYDKLTIDPNTSTEINSITRMYTFSKLPLKTHPSIPQGFPYTSLPRNVSMYSQFNFRVFAGTELAVDIEHTHAPLQKFPVTPNPFDILEEGKLDHILAETYILATLYLFKFPKAVLENDVLALGRLLADVQQNPKRFGRLCADVLAIFLRPATPTPPGVNFFNANSLVPSMPGFSMRGPGLAGLGIYESVAHSKDPACRFFAGNHLLQILGANSAVGVQVICCAPHGLAGLSNCSPPRLLAFLSVNHLQVPGTTYGSQHMLDMPTMKALNDVYEPVDCNVTIANGTISALGLSFKTKEGYPVFGEFSAIVRLSA
jgi:hypothetical protein